MPIAAHNHILIEYGSDGSGNVYRLKHMGTFASFDELSKALKEFGDKMRTLVLDPSEFGARQALAVSGGDTSGSGDSTRIGDLVIPVSPADPRVRAVLFAKRKGGVGFNREDAEKLAKKAFRGKGVSIKRKTQMTAEQSSQQSIIDNALEDYWWFRLRPDGSYDLRTNGDKRDLIGTRVRIHGPDGKFAGIVLLLANAKPRMMKSMGLEDAKKLGARIKATTGSTESDE